MLNVNDEQIVVSIEIHIFEVVTDYKNEEPLANGYGLRIVLLNGYEMFNILFLYVVCDGIEEIKIQILDKNLDNDLSNKMCLLISVHFKILHNNTNNVRTIGFKVH